jgi:hypothetical protein
MMSLNRVQTANLAPVPGRRPGDSGWRGECGSRGSRLVTSALGRLGQDTPVRHHDRSAGAISLDWDFEARVMPASGAWKAGSPASRWCVAMRSVFRTIGTGAPNKSWEVAWLELSGGVRSLPQVPWWNAERRARRKARAVPRGTVVTEQRLSAFRFPFSSLRAAKRRSNPDSVPPTLDCFVAIARRRRA